MSIGTRRSSPKASVACSICFGVAFAAVIGHDNWERLALLQCIPMFCLGVTLYRTRPLALATTSPVLSVLQLLAVIAIIILMHLGSNDAFLVAPFALLIFSTQTDRGVIGAALCSPFLVTIGLMSYSIYMWHIPIRIALVVGIERRFSGLRQKLLRRCKEEL
jgi:peptidoglycan/LPS O-acetylase OafA/YrhL